MQITVIFSLFFVLTFADSCKYLGAEHLSWNILDIKIFACKVYLMYVGLWTQILTNNSPINFQPSVESNFTLKLFQWIVLVSMAGWALNSRQKLLIQGRKNYIFSKQKNWKLVFRQSLERVFNKKQQKQKQDLFRNAFSAFWWFILILTYILYLNLNPSKLSGQ